MIVVVELKSIMPDEFRQRGAGIQPAATSSEGLLYEPGYDEILNTHMNAKLNSKGDNLLLRVTDDFKTGINAKQKGYFGCNEDNLSRSDVEFAADGDCRGYDNHTYYKQYTLKTLEMSHIGIAQDTRDKMVFANMTKVREI